MPIPCTVTINPDRSYNLEMKHPPWSYFLKQAAGIQRGAMSAYKGEIAGMITRKHVYEIAKIKLEDPEHQMKDMDVMCKLCIDEAYSIGIKVRTRVDPSIIFSKVSPCLGSRANPYFWAYNSFRGNKSVKPINILEKNTSKNSRFAIYYSTT